MWEEIKSNFKVPFVLISAENGADYVSEHFIPKRKSAKTTLKQIPLRKRDKEKSCFKSIHTADAAIAFDGPFIAHILLVCGGIRVCVFSLFQGPYTYKAGKIYRIGL